MTNDSSAGAAPPSPGPLLETGDMENGVRADKQQQNTPKGKGGDGVGHGNGGSGEIAPAPMRNLYAAALSYNGYTITDGALRLIVLLNAARLGFNAIEIAFMFSMYEVRDGEFTPCLQTQNCIVVLYRIAPYRAALYHDSVGLDTGIIMQEDGTARTDSVVDRACEGRPRDGVVLMYCPHYRPRPE